MKKFIIITSIHGITESIEKWSEKEDWKIIIVGDEKSIEVNNQKNITFLSIDEQLDLGFDFTKKCPMNTYTRKNIGYLYAIRAGADIIYETDDDNSPYDYWSELDFISDLVIDSNEPFINIYDYYTDQFVWPRGLPLEYILGQDKVKAIGGDRKEIGVIQGLADLEPDVDAIYRLVINKQITFEKRDRTLYLKPNTYTPFNSQNTFWNVKAFPFLYLPVRVRFRVCDILRSYIAQRLMWAFNLHLGFSQATVYQNRNEHDLIKDFEDELDCYTSMPKICEAIAEIDLPKDKIDAQLAIYKKLENKGFIDSGEIGLLESWSSDLRKII